MWYVLLLLLCYAFKQNLHAVSHHHTIVDTDKIRPPPKGGRRRRLHGAGPRASERTTVAAHARPDPYLRRRRPPSQTPISRRASVLRTRARADHAPRDQRSTAQGCSARQHTLRAHPSRAERRAAALTGAPGTAAAPPGRRLRMLRREMQMGVCDSGRVDRTTVARGPRSTFLILSRRCALSVHRVHAPCPRH